MVGPREHHRHQEGKHHTIPHPWRDGCHRTIDTTGWHEDLILGEATRCCVGCGCGVVDNPKLFDDLTAEMRFFWLPLSTIEMQWGPLHPHLWMEEVFPLFRIYWFFWLNCYSHDNSSGVCIDDLSIFNIFWIGFYESGFGSLSLISSHQWLFRVTFIGVVPGDFVEVTPFS